MVIMITISPRRNSVKLTRPFFAGSGSGGTGQGGGPGAGKSGGGSSNGGSTGYRAAAAERSEERARRQIDEAKYSDARAAALRRDGAPRPNAAAAAESGFGGPEAGVYGAAEARASVGGLNSGGFWGDRAGGPASLAGSGAADGAPDRGFSPFGGVAAAGGSVGAENPAARGASDLWGLGAADDPVGAEGLAAWDGSAAGARVFAPAQDSAAISPPGGSDADGAQTREGLGGLLSRLLSSVAQLKDIGVRQLTRLVQGGVPEAADALAAARQAVENTYSVSRGLTSLEAILARYVLGSEYGAGAGTGFGGSAVLGLAGGFFGRWGGAQNPWGPGDLGGGGASSAGGGGASAGSGGSWGGSGAWNGAGGFFAGGGGAGTGSGFGGEQGRAVLRELGAIRNLLPGADLKALKNGADISDIYNELKDRLSALESRLSRLGMRQDDPVGKIVSSMKDNIRAQEQLNRNQICFQIPFLYNQKPSSLTVYVFDQKRGGKGKKAGETLSVALNLETETLGTLDIGLKVSEKRVDLEIVAANQTVRNYLNGIVGTLSGRVRDAGFTVGDILCEVKPSATGRRPSGTGDRDTLSLRSVGAEQDAAQAAARTRRRAMAQRPARPGVDLKV
jgi:hypothetical protein